VVNDTQCARIRLSDRIRSRLLIHFPLPSLCGYRLGIRFVDLGAVLLMVWRVGNSHAFYLPGSRRNTMVVAIDDERVPVAPCPGSAGQIRSARSASTRFRTPDCAIVSETDSITNLDVLRGEIHHAIRDFMFLHAVTPRGLS
jgi:hypothetical protein